MEYCVFCSIVNGSLPCYKIYEDNECLAFLDRYPLVQGHTLLIPKKHYRWVWDIENQESFWKTWKSIVAHYQKITKNDFVVSATFGKEIPHAHVHLFPSIEPLEENTVLGAFIQYRGKELSKTQAEHLLMMLKITQIKTDLIA